MNSLDENSVHSSFKRIIPSWVQKAGMSSILKYRQATWRNRSLPDFIIIGAQKSGTTSLYRYLSQHPQLIASYKKEVHFFDGGIDNYYVDNFEKGEAWYRANFPRKRKSNTSQKVFEASPLYLFNPLVPQRIYDFMPEVKLIAILRNPVERAISHYFHAKRKQGVGVETLPMLEAFQAEEERLKPIVKQQDFKNPIFRRHSYKGKGLYYEQLKRYLNYFSNKSILVLDSESFFAVPDDGLRMIFEFVGVDSGFTVPDLKPGNVGKNKVEVGLDVYDYLENYFEPYNQKLYKLLGRSFSW